MKSIIISIYTIVHIDIVVRLCNLRGHVCPMILWAYWLMNNKTDVENILIGQILRNLSIFCLIVSKIKFQVMKV